MDVREPAVPFRVRSFWQAVDTGLLLFQKWPGPVVLLVAVPTLVVAVTTQVFLGESTPWLPPLVVWWMGPLADHLLLAWVGQQFFHPQEPWTKGLRRCTRAFDRSLLADLTYRRFLPWTNVLVPVSLLEGVAPGQRRRRRRWLVTDLRTPALGLAATFLVATVSVGLLLVLSLTSLVSPALWSSSDDWTGTLGLGWAWTVLVAVVQVTVTPLFTLGCFGLYINTRTRKEGWDLSVAFRALRQRGPRSAPWTALVLMVLLGTVAVGRVDAGPFVSPREGDPVPPRATAWARAVSGPEFGRTETSWKWKWKTKRPEKAETTPDFSLSPVSWSAELLRGFAVLAGLGLVALVVWGLWTSRVGRRAPREPARLVPPRESLGTAVDDARKKWAAGDPRAALSVLYQFVLEETRRRCQLPVPGAATEADVVGLLARAQADHPRWCSAVHDVVVLWSQAAWAGQTPDGEKFEAVLVALAAPEGSEVQR